MKILTIAVGLLAAGTLLFSCGKNECMGNCKPVFPKVNFKIVNGIGQNLVCGSNKIYTSDRIQIRYEEAGVEGVAVKAFDGDTTLNQTGLFFVAQLNSQFYLYIDGIKTDSFQVKYANFAPLEDCCAAYNTITELKLNNVLTTYTYPDNDAAVNLIK